MRILPRAEADVESIYDWIATRSPEGACRWFQAFETASDSVRSSPLSYSLARENDYVHYELRQFLFKTSHGRTYRAVYVVVGDEIRILRVRGPGQKDLERGELLE